jgi:lysophospholipase
MQLVSLGTNPTPSGGAVGSFSPDDGVDVRFATFPATRGPRRGTVCVLPGRGEFIEKYFEVIAELRRRGFMVAILDWRGQGGSTRPLADKSRHHVASFAAYDRDLARFMRDVVLPDCPPPYVALAHSMGGNILLRHAVDPGSWFERMVLCAPMIEIAQERIKLPLAVARTYAETVSLIGGATFYVRGGSGLATETLEFKGNLLTSDQHRYERNREILRAAPELGIGSPTIGWFRGALRSCAIIGASGYPRQIKVPALMFAAAKDELVSVAAIERFATELKVGTHILMPGAKHEILQETDEVRQRFWAAFDAYLGVDRVAA